MPDLQEESSPEEKEVTAPKEALEEAKMEGIEAVDETYVHVKSLPASKHPRFAAFFKMLRVGVPLQAVQGKMLRDGLDATILENPEKLVDIESVDDDENREEEVMGDFSV